MASLALFLGTLPGSACLWDSDTLKDEVAVASGAAVFDLIIGQFPHHGKGYYQSRIERLEAVVSSGQAKAEESNDLAVAYIRIGEFDKAELLLKQRLAVDLKDYVSLSNMGVLEKKRGQFGEAAGWIAKALEVKPDGHMGLGDWYEKMLVYRAEIVAQPEVVPVRNFLGMAYADSFVPNLGEGSITLEQLQKSSLNLVSRENVLNLLRNDQSFADGFMLAGDLLAFQGHLHLAFLAYTRAMALEHPNPKEIKRRRRALLLHREDAEDLKFRGNSNRMEWWEKEVALAGRTIGDGASWLAQFQNMESKLVAKKGDRIEFADVEDALAEDGVVRVRP